MSYTVSHDSTAGIERQAYDIAALCKMSAMPQPDVLIADIEGSEAILLEPGVTLPTSIQHVIIELHPGLYRNATADRDRLIRFFHDQGLPLESRIDECYLFTRSGNRSDSDV